MEIPEPRQPAPAAPIPSSIAERPQNEEAPEAEGIMLSFARYNQKECGIDAMDNKRARKALQAIRDVGIMVRTETDFKSKLPKLDVSPVGNHGDYRNLYRGLIDLPDIEIKEAKIDRDKGRLFFFMIERIFYIVAIGDNHYETDKQRR